MSQHPADKLIQEIAETGRPATEDELRLISEHIANLGFAPDELSRHYQKHVKMAGEWPRTTDEDSYLNGLKEMIRREDSGIAVSRWWRNPQWHVTVMGGSGPFRGPSGQDWIAVEYRLGDGSWATAFQPEGGLGHVDSHHRRRDVRWLRQPK